MRCLWKPRIEAVNLIAVSCQRYLELPLFSAIDKLTAFLETILGRLQSIIKKLLKYKLKGEKLNKKLGI